MRPTEQDIREAIRIRLTRLPGDNPRLQLEEAITAFADVLSVRGDEEEEGPDEPDAPYRVWGDLRPSEAVKLRILAGDAIEQAMAQAEDVIVYNLVQAGLAFAEMFPEAPRARVPVG
jgi:hypothetical protein